jgi:hypothetical protein
MEHSHSAVSLIDASGRGAVAEAFKRALGRSVAHDRVGELYWLCVADEVMGIQATPRAHPSLR